MGPSIIEPADRSASRINPPPPPVMPPTKIGNGHIPNNLRMSPVRKSFNTLKRHCREQGVLFEDPDFPPGPKTLFGKSKPQVSGTVWLRPFELCNRPKFIAEGATRFDVEQGELGDCWLVAAISCLTLTPRLLDRVVPADQSFGPGYCGLFRFRFWRFGEWVEVVVDDRLPTVRGRLLYLHSSDPTEFWAALLEKAYAKFYGGYDALHNGSTARALQDLTGGISQSFQLGAHDAHIVQQIISSAVPRSTLLAVSIVVRDHKKPLRLRNGLITHHAYSVTGLARVRFRLGEVSLVRLRNPWGKGEWNGAWSDRSWEWDNLAERDREALTQRVRNDGEFWIAFDDFVRSFTQLDLVHIGPDDWMQEATLHNKRPWRAVLARRRWRRGFNAGGCPTLKTDTAPMNPQFHIHIPKNSCNKCHAVVSVTQLYHTCPQQDPGKLWVLHPIGFAVYEVPPNLHRVSSQFMSTHRPLDITLHSATREIVTFFTLPPGDFVVIPCTTSPNCETKFLLRILTDEQSNIWEVNEDNLVHADLTLSKQLEFNGNGVLSRLMQKLPYEVDALLLLKIMKACWRSLQILSGKPSLELSRYLVMLRDPNISGKVCLEEVPALLQTLNLWRAIFLKYDKSHCGRTSSFNLRPLLWETGITVSNKVLECLVIRFAKDGVVTLENYLMALVKLYLAHERYRTVEKKMKDNCLSLEEMILLTIYS